LKEDLHFEYFDSRGRVNKELKRESLTAMANLNKPTLK
jgi:hypothetical protein